MPDGVTRMKLLPPSENNPRNSEGDFIQLQDGRILFVYTHFVGGPGDNDAAYLASRESADGGETWSEADVEILPNEAGLNVMSVSLLRLQSDEIALFYLQKNSTTDCRPYIRFSTDECATFGEPTLCVPDDVGYYIVNNDRVIQLKTGRLVIPTVVHDTSEGEMSQFGTAMCYLSDDDGRTWR
jgi:hypothetical protein